MVRRTFCLVCVTVGLFSSSFTETAQGQYRGTNSSWPAYANGAYAAYYPSNAGNGPAYYVARPVVAAQYAPQYGPQYTAGYAPQYVQAQYAPAQNGMMQYAPAPYAPVRAAYANPTYFGAYNGSAGAYPAPVRAYYAPASGQYASAGDAYYAPTTANYAPTNSYRVSPAGSTSAGAEAYYNYGQPTAVNYVPPRFTYRPAYASVPVYMYRPVTVYDPITAQPVTCLQPTTTSQCQSQPRRSWFSWLNPFSWHQSSGGCGAPPPRTSYCTTGYCGTAPAAAPCGQQPYYPAQPTVVIPSVPTTVVPAPTTQPTFTSPIPSGTYIPPGGATISPPPTRSPGGSFQGGLSPADTVPRLPAGTTIPPAQPGSGGSFSPPPGSGSFNYPPANDPYSSQSTTSTNASGANTFGSGYSATGAAVRSPQQSRTNTAPGPGLRQPELNGPNLNSAIQPVPDPAGLQAPRPINRAPQLIDPRDKSARMGDSRWAVVPAVWPSKTSQREPGSDRRGFVETSYSQPDGPSPYKTEPMQAQPAQNTNAADYDDRGWSSARGL